ncbi:hypothetical protein E2C01_012766 [Portunus trituberculatus]|uniref:Uncharacterized protein n=1 Tax=Portunus trituberculatus TaxID=210409 RepID=A0A5B7DFI2_PORTR|nr:hypothetical protein [Portunus trituberculatus]
MAKVAIVFQQRRVARAAGAIQSLSPQPNDSPRGVVITGEKNLSFSQNKFFVARGSPERPLRALRRLTARRSKEQGLLRPCGHSVSPRLQNAAVYPGSPRPTPSHPILAIHFPAATCVTSTRS